MKVLFLVEQFMPVMCGMSVVSHKIAKYFVENDVEVEVFTSKNNELEKQEIIDGISVKRFNNSGNAIAGIKEEKAGSFIKDVLNSDADYIFAWAAQQWSFDLLFQNIDQIKKKIIFIPTGFSQLHNPIFKDYFESIYNQADLFDKIIFLSRDYQDFKFMEKSKSTDVIIPNGADLEEFLSASLGIKEKLGIAKSQRVILHVGGYTGLKGQYYALKIFLNAKLENTVLVLNGNGNIQNDSFIKKIKRRLKGSLSRADIASYLRMRKIKNVLQVDLDRGDLVSLFKESDLFLFPSLIECSPLVIFEAMASRTPFLVTDVGNCEEIVDTTAAGVLLPTKMKFKNQTIVNIKESGKVLNEIFNDSTKLNELGEKGYEAFQKKFNWNIIGQQYLDLIREK